jgi:hypothetical protein
MLLPRAPCARSVWGGLDVSCIPSLLKDLVRNAVTPSLSPHLFTLLVLKQLTLDGLKSEGLSTITDLEHLSTA